MTQFTPPQIFVIGTASLDTLHLADGRTAQAAGGAVTVEGPVRVTLPLAFTAARATTRTLSIVVVTLPHISATSYLFTVDWFGQALLFFSL